MSKLVVPQHFLKLNKMLIASCILVLNVTPWISQLLLLPRQALALQPVQTSPDSQVQQSNGWRSFSPPTGEFTVSMPANVRTRNINRSGLAYTVFCTEDSGYVYWVLVPVNTTYNFIRSFLLDDFKEKDTKSLLADLVAGAKDGVTGSGGKIVFASDLAGSGWDGELIDATYQNNKKASTLLAYANGTHVAYTLITTAPIDSDEAARFFYSWVVNPSKVIEAHKQDPQMPWSPSAYDIGKMVGLWGSRLVLVLVLILIFNGSVRNKILQACVYFSKRLEGMSKK